MNIFINTPQKMSTKNNMTMNSTYKLLILFTAIIFSSLGFSQNADPGIGILMSPPSLTQGASGTLSAIVGNYGNSTIVSNSLQVTISVGTNAEILGIASGSDSRWTLVTLTTGSANSITLKNTAGGFTPFDVGEIFLTIRGNVVGGLSLILGNIAYINESNPLLCGVCPPIPLNATQGNASTTNNNSQTSLIVTAPIIDAINDILTAVNGTATTVITNDTLNGVSVVIGTNPGNVTLTSTPTSVLSINAATGVVTVAPNTPVGTYSISYTICEVTNPTNCDTAIATVTVTAPIIDAVTDTTTAVNGTTGGATIDLTDNDTLNGVPVVIGTAPGNVVLTPVTVPTGLTLNPNGTVTIAPNTPAGTYPVIYTICEVTNPTNCDTVTSKIVVELSTIDAVTDTTPAVNGTTGGATIDLTDNDTLNGVPVLIGTAPGNVVLTPVTVPTGLTLNPNGTITIAPNTPAGTYPVIYTICEVTNPTNCDTVTSSIVVGLSTIDAVTDTTPAVNGTTGGTTIDLTDNDTLNGVPVVIGTAPGNVVLTPVTVPTGLTLNPNGTVTIAPNTPAGTYPVIYTICEVTNPTNCDTVTSSIVVVTADLTPTIDIDNIVFLTAGVSRDFVVNISNIGSAATNGQVVFIIPKQSAFTITYNPTAILSNVGGGTDINNNDWIITENSLFITVTLKASVIINTSTFSSIGFTITRKPNVPNQTWQPITATILNGSGSDSINENNTYNVVVKAQ